MKESFDVPLVEDAKYYEVDKSYKDNARTRDYKKTYKEFIKAPDAFWEKIAGELEWFRKWDRVKEWNYPY
ncbi:MAG: acetyl-coenzyme A synthetase, partial [Methanoregulaceae archaeon]|nr:acetyl-coenzyme A synthetase [Methanoregulaceae archaeon]